MSAGLRCVVNGPGRTRNGLGPFLASFLEDAGVQVVAGVGRDLGRTRDACAVLGERVGHSVEAFTDVGAALRETAVDALVIASPAPTHLAALEAALAAGVAVLCEKPLVTVDRVADAAALLDGFAEAGLLLAENCQWPLVLPAFDVLWPDRPAVPPRRIAMRLSPSGTGRAMLEDSLSHLLSLIQAVVAVDAGTRLVDPRIAGASTYAVACEVGFGLEGPGEPVEVRFELRRETGQPRPAWIELDGRRADRRIEPGSYAMELAAPDGRSVPLDDPLAALVYGFAADLRAPTVERIRDQSDRIRHRLRLYAEVLAGWPRGAARRGDP